jgi:drug/metabolite transporter (DMT)-like permease
MVAFAANSVLNKLGIAQGGMEPLGFAMLRLWSGALMLLMLIWIRRNPTPETGSLIGTASLLVYMLGFSLAYVTLDAGVGALILFGVVQITMFAAAAVAGERIPAMRYIGCGVAFFGLAALLWPAGGAAPDLWGALLMAAAGVGWGVYTLVGRGAAAPLLRTERNFRYAALFMIAIAVVIGLPMGGPVGYAAAVASGAFTSALGYALWYRVLPALPTTIAATAQLTVPVIALAGGMAFLGEELTVRFAVASLLVLGGVAIALRKST